MKKVVTVLGLIAVTWALSGSIMLYSQTPSYIGSSKCQPCHDNVNPSVGYNIWQEFHKTGHPYKLNLINGAPPVYPPNTTPGVPNTPEGTTWSDFTAVIGGYGWKARFIKHDGNVYTATDKVQYNLATSGWVPYNQGQDVPYNESCFKCHTTGPSTEGSWIPTTPGLGTFSEPGVRCEGCHGPGSEHAANPVAVKPPNAGKALTYDRCGDCHQRGGKTNAIPAKAGFIEHHESFNEMQASKHGTSGLTCGTCHDTHIALVYPNVAGAGLKALKTDCATCHPNRDIKIDGVPKQIACIDCHMAEAGKSAVGVQTGNGWKGDIATHLWKINTDAVTKTAMFTPDGKAVQLDTEGRGAVTLDFACLNCHQQQTVEWASSYAKNIHVNGITTGIAATGMPESFDLMQNYPNPFNPTTAIKFQIPVRSNVLLQVINLQGEVVETLVNETRNAGTHEVVFDAEGYPSGMYFYRIMTGGKIISKKMILSK